MYRSKRFRIRRLDDIRAEIDEIAADYAAMVDRVFLADGDALVLKTSNLLQVLAHLHRRFPRLRRINAYATPQNFLHKSVDELHAIQAAGLHMLYVGLESGDAEILQDVDKGVTPSSFIEACDKAQRAGFRLSLTVLNNLVGKERSAQHVEGTVTVINQVASAYVSCLTLIPGPMLELHRAATAWSRMSDVDVLDELAGIVGGIDVDRLEFRANHASNPLPIKGRLPHDRQRLLDFLSIARQDPSMAGARPDWMRRL